MNEQRGSDQTIILLIAAFGLMLGIYALWIFQHAMVVNIVFSIRSAELVLVEPLAKCIYTVMHYLHLPAPDISNIITTDQFVKFQPDNQVSVEDLKNVSLLVGDYMRYITAVVLGLFALYCFKFNSASQFKQIYNMKSLREAEVKLWPQTSPILHLDLRNTDIETGEWSMAQRPVDFCLEHNLLEKPGAEEDVWKFLKAKSQTVFAMQMGPLFRSPQALPIYMQALFVIFCACALGKRKQADKLIAQIAISSKNGGKLNFAGVTEQLNQLMSERIVGWLAARHAYVYGFMASLLECARTDGVVASAEFLWLKPLDRRLWFVLNGVGRQTAVTEVAAPVAHWKAEKRFKCALRIPMIHEAVKAIDLAIKEVKYMREEDQWRNAG